MSGSSANGDAHASVDMAADFGAGFLPLLGEHGLQFPQQNLGFFAERGDHPQTLQTEKSADVARGRPAFPSRIHELLTLGRVFRPIGLSINDAVRTSHPKATNPHCDCCERGVPLSSSYFLRPTPLQDCCRCGFWVRRELRMWKGPWKQGRSIRRLFCTRVHDAH
jgi:hypothetical protein